MDNNTMMKMEVASFLIDASKVKDSHVSKTRIQMLLYYIQSASLILLQEDLGLQFTHDVKGPNDLEVYEAHRNQTLPNTSANLNNSVKLLATRVMNYFDEYNKESLSELAHKSEPWKCTSQGDKISTKRIEDDFGETDEERSFLQYIANEFSILCLFDDEDEDEDDKVSCSNSWELTEQEVTDTLASIKKMQSIRVK